MAALAGQTVTNVCIGYYSAMAVTLSGALYSWGLDGDSTGCLGHGHGIAEVWEPLAVQHLQGIHIEEAALGQNKHEPFALARSASGAVFAWGGSAERDSPVSGVIMGHGPGVARQELPAEVSKLAHFERHRR